MLNTSNHIAEDSSKEISAKAPKLKVVYKNIPEDSCSNDLAHFEWLYDNYAPKAYGFIVSHTNSKEQAEEYMMNVFLKVWENIKTFDHEAEKKIQHIVLMACKQLYL